MKHNEIAVGDCRRQSSNESPENGLTINIIDLWKQARSPSEAASNGTPTDSPQEQVFPSTRPKTGPHPNSDTSAQPEYRSLLGTADNSRSGKRPASEDTQRRSVFKEVILDIQMAMLFGPSGIPKQPEDYRTNHNQDERSPIPSAIPTDQGNKRVRSANSLETGSPEEASSPHRSWIQRPEVKALMLRDVSRIVLGASMFSAKPLYAAPPPPESKK